MRTEFLGAAYKSRSAPLSAQSLVNLFFEPAAPGSAYEGMFYGSPGLALHKSLGTQPIRGLHVTGSVLWALAGTTLYRIDTALNATAITTIAGTNRVCMVHNDTQLVVMHEAGWTIVTLASLAIATPAGAPTTAQGTYQDGYVVFPKADGTYGWTALQNAASLDALDFASAEAQPDPIIAVLSDHRELWLFGDETTEIAQTSGDADLVFTRTAIMEHGCAAKYSPAKADNTVFWLGRDPAGRGVVYRAEGYTPSRISTFALETAIAGYANPSSAWGYCYQQNGHTFYVLTFDEATWAYDASSQRWTQLAYRDPVSGALKRHLGNAYAFFNGRHVLGDYATGSLYRLDLDTYTDNGTPIYRERAWSVIEAENRWVRHDRMEIMAEMGVGLVGRIPGTETLIDESGVPVTDEAALLVLDDTNVALPDTGADPALLLSWSDDGCRTWGNDHVMLLGRTGRFRNRAIARRLGLSRNRVYRLRITDPVKVALYGANLDATPTSR